MSVLSLVNILKYLNGGIEMKGKRMFKNIGFMTLAIPMLLLGIAAGASAEDDEVIRLEKTVNYTCSGPTINFPLEATISADPIPESIAPEEQVVFENSQVSVKLPPLVVEVLRFTYLANAISGTVTTFNVNAYDSNGLWEELDVANPPIDIPETNLPSLGQPLVFTVPENGINVGPFTAPNESGVLTFKAEELQATITAHRFIGGESYIDISCTPTGDNELITIDVE